MFPSDIRAIQGAYSSGGHKAAMVEIRRRWPGLSDHVARGAVAQIMGLSSDSKKSKVDVPTKGT